MLNPPRHLTLYTSGICRGPCKPDFCCTLFHLPDLDTILDLRFFVYFTGHTDFDCGLFRFPDFSVNGAQYGGCDQSTVDAYFVTPGPTSGFSRGPC